MNSEPFLMCDQSVTPERLIAMGIHKNDSHRFAGALIFSKLIKGRSVNSRRDGNWFHIEKTSESEWLCNVGSLMLNVRNMQDVADIIAVLEK